MPQIGHVYTVGHKADGIAGVDVVKVSDLTVEKLAPGAKAGRLAIYTEAALAEIAKLS